MSVPRIGILGGGQLARMLLLSGYPLGLEPHVLTKRADDPAAQICGRVTLGDADDPATLKTFLRRLDVVTFESEFVDIARVRRAAPRALRAFPDLGVIAELQDRLTQKRLLDRYRIATSPWLEVRDAPSLKAVPFPRFVLKQRRFGYDGYGTFVFETPPTTADVLRRSAAGFIAEEFQNFERELAVTFVRGVDGAFETLPLVESVQRETRCFSVAGPVTHPGLKTLRAQFRRLMTELDYVGVLAVELFEVNGRLIVNELAPRVHNSAHYSQDALNCSQFEYHWRAGLGWRLPRPGLTGAPAFAMVNLLGAGHPNVRLNQAGPGHLHWYGKRENRPGRKLGHVNVTARTPRKALAAALAWAKEFTL